MTADSRWIACGHESYDQIYSSGGASDVYNLPYKRSRYYPMFRRVVQDILESGASHVLDVGSGNGALAEMILERTPVTYRGFDFSPVAVARARVRVGRDDLMFIGDARDPASYGGEYDCIVCTEVLEHVLEDLEVVSNWRSGSFCVCSVPNFDSRLHVRHFGGEDEIRIRYGDLIGIERIRRVTCPDLRDLSISYRLRACARNILHPTKLERILGFKSFADGGWFVFSGRRR